MLDDISDDSSYGIVRVGWQLGVTAAVETQYHFFSRHGFASYGNVCTGRVIPVAWDTSGLDIGYRSPWCNLAYDEVRRCFHPGALYTWTFRNRKVVGRRNKVPGPMNEWMSALIHIHMDWRERIYLLVISNICLSKFVYQQRSVRRQFKSRLSRNKP